jgi:hypothetical protein
LNSYLDSWRSFWERSMSSKKGTRGAHMYK